ncbi:MAG: anti-anti-sigma factor [gamma proteobacterium symbiont of Ctena orbiculata]|uniref:STAS domain-containing protein n=1 Tax=Candidatus Thiodiazotropha taylori TaxID=2792791 RepID=A0A944MDC9_9GAMM|nr:STAS domain-containing protein [Candidatus Thiodiazotropha taylori]PUB89946.1 MAG: anti-sigma factor antagonist [gamma proteobacterium symbiont of Ctena orbiculata]MBT2988935.1 STAS domain-containing protein [Candidatus Thiodiazotropha taylori]MBT2996419.1 STAS domain-containing protein [Candidatus Thiodiazotropha taylori]MBT3000147.1 STAS domain-containing protein [Candidatus Thiodiazotropha taylori]
MSIATELSADEKSVTIVISGRFDFSIHQEFMQAYKAFPKGDKRYVVDLTDADYLDSSAMGMLLQLREHSAKDADGVVLKNGNEAVQDVLRIANFGKLFTIQ